MDDYLVATPMQYTYDFILSDEECRLCGALDALHRVRHAHGSVHRKNVHEYNMTMNELNIVDRECYVRNDGPVSKREVVLNYLQGRVTRADGVHNVKRFHEMAMAFLHGRCSLFVLLQAFKLVNGTERARRRGTCVVCMDRPASIMFSSCFHVCTCAMCAARIKTHAGGQENVPCPVCRKESTTVAVYIS